MLTIKSPVFEKTYQDYLSRISVVDFKAIAEKLGGRVDANGIVIPFLGKSYRISSHGIMDPYGNRPIHAITVVLSKYILLCPQENPGGSDWVSYRDFKDAAPFAGAFANQAEKTIAENFSGRLDKLVRACEKVGSRPTNMDLSYDLARVFDALPRIPVLFLFNDADDEFPAQCSILFKQCAEKYLDMECLAIVGWLLSDYLKQDGGGLDPTLM
jgi:hypothetical protein